MKKTKKSGQMKNNPKKETPPVACLVLSAFCLIVTIVIFMLVRNITIQGFDVEDAIITFVYYPTSFLLVITSTVVTLINMKKKENKMLTIAFIINMIAILCLLSSFAY